MDEQTHLPEEITDSTGHKTALYIIIGILIVGAGLAWYFLSQKSEPIVNTNTNTNSNTHVNVDSPATITNLEDQGNINKFASYQEFTEFIENNPLDTSNYYRENNMVMRENIAMPDSFAGFSEQSLDSATPFAPTAQKIAGTDYSQTNIQVEGVDEADIVKTDGIYIYIVSNNDLFIVEAHPTNNAKILSKIAFTNQPENIYVNDDSLIIYGHDNTIHDADICFRCPEYTSFTFFKVFDISDRTNPVQVRDLDFEGYYTNSRMIGDYVYFITSKSTNTIDPLPLPRIIENGTTLINDPENDNFQFPDVYYLSIPYRSYNLTNIASINVKKHNQDIETEVYMLDGAQNMYVSQDNIYVTYTRYLSPEEVLIDVIKDVMWSRINVKDQERITEIEGTPTYILSPSEKVEKILYIFDLYESRLTQEERENLEKELFAKVKVRYTSIRDELERTIIHKININKGSIEYQGEGSVPGNVLNQFSMDERDGYFRIATTKNQNFALDLGLEDEPNESYSNVYVLNDKLQTVGKVERLAPGERIFSARFMHDRAYLVTFRQTDPFFTIDLKDPKNPKVLGELKIPGFSDYLHPYGDNNVIGLGKDGGLKISLFDVSDVTNPIEIDKYIFEDSSSDSISRHDHKAFLFSADKNLLVIPLTTFQRFIEPFRGELSFFPEFRSQQLRGAAVFNITEDSIKLTGLINHDDASNTRDNRYGYYDTQVNRSLFIDDVLYTVSGKFLKMNQLPGIEDIKTLELKKNAGPSDDFNVVN